MSEYGFTHRYRFNKVSVLVMLAISIPIIFLVSISVGVVPVSLLEVALSVLGFNEVDPIAFTVIFNIRVPRALMALISGSVLAVSGATLQGVLRNPLVSPFTLGVSSGASFGAALAIVLGVGLIGSSSYIVMFNAFILSLIHI